MSTRIQAPARWSTRDMTGHGTARDGTARHGTARHGTAGHGRARRVAATVATTAAITGGLGLAAAPAEAASAISSCFSYNGVAYTGLATTVEYYAVNGRWYGLSGSEASVLSNGCITYTITGAARSYYLRIRATGAMPAWGGMLTGTSYYYGPSGYGSYSLGAGRLGFQRLTTPQVDALSQALYNGTFGGQSIYEGVSGSWNGHGYVFHGSPSTDFVNHGVFNIDFAGMGGSVY